MALYMYHIERRNTKVKTSKAQLNASKKYIGGKDRIYLTLNKGDKWVIEQIALDNGFISSQDFIRHAIDFYKTIILHNADEGYPLPMEYVIARDIYKS